LVASGEAGIGEIRFEDWLSPAIPRGSEEPGRAMPTVDATAVQQQVKGGHMKRLQVERLAYSLWEQRGMPLGSPDEDWFRAEELLKTQFKGSEPSMYEVPLFAFSMEKQTR
jgi:hypothetical protein